MFKVENLELKEHEIEILRAIADGAKSIQKIINTTELDAEVILEALMALRKNKLIANTRMN